MFPLSAHCSRFLFFFSHGFRSSVRRQCGFQTPTEVAHGAYESPECPLQLTISEDTDDGNATFTRQASRRCRPRKPVLDSGCSNRIVRHLNFDTANMSIAYPQKLFQNSRFRRKFRRRIDSGADFLRCSKKSFRCPPSRIGVLGGGDLEGAVRWSEG